MFELTDLQDFSIYDTLLQQNEKYNILMNMRSGLTLGLGINTAVSLALSFQHIPITSSFFFSSILMVGITMGIQHRVNKHVDFLSKEELLTLLSFEANLRQHNIVITEKTLATALLFEYEMQLLENQNFCCKRAIIMENRNFSDQLVINEIYKKNGWQYQVFDSRTDEYLEDYQKIISFLKHDEFLTKRKRIL